MWQIWQETEHYEGILYKLIVSLPGGKERKKKKKKKKKVNQAVYVCALPLRRVTPGVVWGVAMPSQRLYDEKLSNRMRSQWCRKHVDIFNYIRRRDGRRADGPGDSAARRRLSGSAARRVVALGVVSHCCVDRRLRRRRSVLGSAQSSSFRKVCDGADAAGNDAMPVTVECYSIAHTPRFAGHVNVMRRKALYQISVTHFCISAGARGG